MLLSFYSRLTALRLKKKKKANKMTTLYLSSGIDCLCAMPSPSLPPPPSLPVCLADLEWPLGGQSG